MRYELFDYQEEAVSQLVSKIAQRQMLYSGAYPEYSAIVLAAPTGAGKTVVAAAVMEHLLDSSDILDASDGRTVLWITDDVSLNEQTRLKMQLASDRSLKTEFIVSGSFDQEALDPGTLYFMNTQTAGSNARLSNQSDTQKWTIWETLANTVKERGSDFIVVIDEAHRGTQSKRDTPTIVSKVIDGTAEYGHQRVPIIIGISATADKFTKSMKLNFSQHASSRTLVDVQIPVEKVKESGIIKDRIVLYSPHEESKNVEADTTLLRDAVRRVKDFSRRWREYCTEQEEEIVRPALVVQVGNEATDSHLSELAAVILDEWKSITINNIVNVFGEHETRHLSVGDVPYLEPHMIQGIDDVRVVFAKEAITTGWDCPRAEVLVSFRRAQDATYIAQLIGRIVRQPLARRIVSDEALNGVYCMLPHFSGKQVDAVAALFNDSSENAVSKVVKGTISNTWNTDLFDLDVQDEDEYEAEELARQVRAEKELKAVAAETKKPLAPVAPVPVPAAKVVVAPALALPVFKTRSERREWEQRHENDGDIQIIQPVDVPTAIPQLKPVDTTNKETEGNKEIQPVATQKSVEKLELVDVPTTVSVEDMLEGLDVPRREKPVQPRGPKKPKVIKVLESLPTYSIPNRKPKTSQIARLHKLAALLSLHKIQKGASEEANNLLHHHLDYVAMQRAEELEKRIEIISHVTIGSKVFTTDGQELVSEDGTATRSAKLDKNNINDVFKGVERALLRDGLAKTYWKHSIAEEDASDTMDAKVKVAALGSMNGVLSEIENRAEQIVDEWLKKNKLKISELHETQQTEYKKLRGESRVPQEARIVIPNSIETEGVDGEDGESVVDTIRQDDANRYAKHLFSDPGATDKKYYAALKPWEDKLVRELIAKDDTVAWYRNPARGGERSLCIPYETVKSGRKTYAAMYPDFIVLRKDASTGEIKAVIVDPHGEHLSDSADKLRGLVEYAMEHGDAYRAIYPIIEDKDGGKALTLTLHVAETRDKVIAALDEGVDVVTIYRNHGAEWVA